MGEVVEVKTIGEVERIVLASGEWAGTEPVEFSNTGMAGLMGGGWQQAWSPSEEHQHPVFARAVVHRKDVPIPVTVVIRWDEQFPADNEEWAEKWTRSPMRHFGRTARMVAFRQAFRDLLGDIVVEDEADAHEPTAAEEQAPRDWAAEITAADTVETIDGIVKDARKARVFTPDATGTALDRQWKARRREILARATAAAEASTEPEQPARPVPHPPKQRPEDTVNRRARRAAKARS